MIYHTILNQILISGALRVPNPRLGSLAIQSSLIKKMESDAQKVPNPIKPKRDGVMRTQNYNFNQCSLRKF